ncbi:hypothetical protein JYU34_010479 [Plutella xylostella]|uniref:Potassium channel domain-containing protein n=1 Tax=Plutella xylostella TaxID=51655 RepID=A0ABQ7QII6_PLUXY|nr:hypothetical protein JYU34_010479 [Plutella xylostella]
MPKNIVINNIFYISPTSPAWLQAVQRRIEDTRRLTEDMTARGARQSGHYWSLPGTFLFMVYVCSALGFGAPVPQTVFGRAATLLYAGLAIPTHIFLMINASTCILVNVENVVRNMKKQNHEKVKVALQSTSEEFQKENALHLKTKSKVTTWLRDMAMVSYIWSILYF